MSTRIEKILLKARDVLADPLKERWSDERLIRLVDEGQKDIARHSKILHGQVSIPLAQDQATYSLPDDVWLMTRASFDDCPIPFLSYSNLDRQDFIASLQNYTDNYSYGSQLNTFDFQNINYACWELTTASRVTAMVYDQRNMSEFRVFPIPDEGINTVTYTFENAGPILFAGDELLGIVTAITDYTFDSIYGVVTGLFDPDVTENFLSLEGVVTSITEVFSNIHIWYIKDATEITSIDDTLELAPIFDTAIRYFVIAHAFLDDIDTSFRERGDNFVDMYSRELGLIQDTSNKNGVRATQYKTNFRSAFE